MTAAAQHTANQRWPNHTYARGVFLSGVRWHEEQPVTITDEQDMRVYSAVLETLVNDHEHPGADVIVDAVYRVLGIRVKEES